MKEKEYYELVCDYLSLGFEQKFGKIEKNFEVTAHSFSEDLKQKFDNLQIRFADTGKANPDISGYFKKDNRYILVVGS